MQERGAKEIYPKAINQELEHQVSAYMSSMLLTGMKSVISDSRSSPQSGGLSCSSLSNIIPPIRGGTHTNNKQFVITQNSPNLKPPADLVIGAKQLQLIYSCSGNIPEDLKQIMRSYC